MLQTLLNFLIKAWKVNTKLYDKNGVPDLMQPATQLPEECMHKLIDNMYAK